ncbi:hypothetical protein ACF0H5_024494 [Mactra antiquata]
MTLMLFLLSVLLVTMATSESASSNTTLQCLSCQRATTTDDCLKTVACNAAMEVCQQGLGSIGSLIGKREDLLACSRCCSFENHCNRKLCGIKSTTKQCFHCGEDNGYYNLTSSQECSDLQMCSTNEVCSAEESFLDGHIVHTFGCKRATICKVLLLRSMQHHKICISKTLAPPTGVSIDEYCGTAQSVGRRSISTCQICCYDHMCNNDTCTNIIARLVTMETQGKLDLNNL